MVAARADAVGLSEGARLHSVGVNSFTEFSGDECRGAGIVGPDGTGFHWEDSGLEVLAALTFWAEEEAGRVLFSEPDEFEIVVGCDSEAGIAFDETVAVFTGGLDGSHVPMVRENVVRVY